MILDFKILSLWFVIKDWWYNAITRENNWFLNVLVKSNFATPIPFGSVSCFVVGIFLSNYNFNLFLIHQASYSKEYQRYLMHRENLGSIWKIGRYPIKVSEVLVFLKYCRCLCSVSVPHDAIGWSVIVTFRCHTQTRFIQARLSKIQGPFNTILQFSRTKSSGKILI